MAQLARIQPIRKAAAPPNKADMLAEALEKGMKTPWKGIRPDLRLHKGGLDMEDRQTYVIEDPVAGHHYEIGEAEARFFLCLVTEDDIQGAVHKLLTTTSLRPGIEDILSFLRMLQMHRLALIPEETAREMALNAEKAKASMAAQTGRWSDLTLMQKWQRILFLRLPLLRPDRLLTQTYPWLSPFWSRPFLFAYAVLGVVGLVMVLQQVELYLHTVSYMYTPKGAAAFMLALAGVKVFHEFAHAFAAKRYGLYVRRMGIYFFCFMPMLYTDVTDAWKLSSRRAKLMIAGAGMLTELVIAGLALFFWAVLPNGIARSLAFFVSGASLISTFVANLNPLMRFDGYYLLMDWLRINSLRTRSVMMYKYHLRRMLVDWKGPKPEEHPWERGMVVFGVFTSMYIVVITVSVWAVIWSIFPNLWTLIGMAVGGAIFFFGPLVREIRELFMGRRYWGRPWRIALTVAICGVFIGMGFVPMPEKERLPALFLYSHVARMEAPTRGRLITPLPELGAPVRKGDLLARMEDPFLDREMESVKTDLEQTEAMLQNTLGGGAEGGFRKWLLAERQRIEARLEKLDESRSQMEVRASLDGQILDVNPALALGSHIHKRAYLFTVGSRDGAEVRAYLHEKAYHRFRPDELGDTSVVFRDLETASIPARFVEVLHFPTMEFPNQTLFDFAGGPILSSMTMLGASQDAGNPRGKSDNPTVSADMTLNLSKGVYAKEAWFPVTFSVPMPSSPVRHGTPCSIRVEIGEASVKDKVLGYLWRTLAIMGVFDVSRNAG